VEAQTRLAEYTEPTSVGQSELVTGTLLLPASGIKLRSLALWWDSTFIFDSLQIANTTNHTADFYEGAYFLYFW